MKNQPRLALAYQSAGAEFDEPERIYRFSLHRRWAEGSTLLWIMLNPSTADEHVLDPTLRRCENFSRAWGYAGFEVANLFALRATDPSELSLHKHPVGPDYGDMNDRAIAAAAARASSVMVGWGRGPSYDKGLTRRIVERGETVRFMLKDRPLACLGTNQDGSPKHPLYLKGTLQPRIWQAA